MEAVPAGGSSVVETSYGAIQGSERDGCLVFHGVPYADPPMRFKRPSAPTPWAGVRDCQKVGKIAVQPLPNVRSLKFAAWLALRATGLSKAPLEYEVPEQMSEDCLYLNVTTPSLSGKRPVLFWIHGGAFVFGSGTSPLYRGPPICKAEDVVVVTINYRLGAFGFMSVPGGDLNCGSWDQLQALRWVHQEIGRFGGDPDRITIMGQSAGAMSTGVLLTSPLTQHLFKRAILMSGALSNCMTAEDAAIIGQDVAEQLGVPLNAEALRGISAKDLLNAQSNVNSAMQFQPCVDGELIVGRPLNALAKGAVSLADKQVLLGCTSKEFNLFKPPNLGRKPLDDLTKKVAAYLGPKRLAVASTEEEQCELQLQLRELMKGIRQARGAKSWDDVEFEFSSLVVFEAPSRLAARQLAESAQSVFMYSIDFDAGRLGPAHAFELPLLFGTHTDNRIIRELCGAQREPEAAGDISRALMSCFCAFARVGAPTPTGAAPDTAAASEEAGGSPAGRRIPHWPAYKPADDPCVFVFDRECHVVRGPPTPVMSETMALLERAQRPYGVTIRESPESRL